MASNPTFCGICDQRHITKPSSDWCSECNQALCTECKDFHALSKASQNHSTIAVSNYLALGSSFSQIEGHCSVHDEKYQLFCQPHDCLLCLSCLEEHAKCEAVVPISRLTKDVKTSESFLDNQKSLSDIILNLSKIQCHLEGNVQDIKKQKESFLQEIIQIREQIDSHLNQIENNLKTELDKLVDDQCNTNIGKTLKEIQKEQTKMENFQQQINVLNEYGSDLQIFFGQREISLKTETTYKYLQAFEDNGSLNKMRISHKIDRLIFAFLKEVKSLCSIQVQKIPSGIVLERSKHKQAQLVGVKKSSINDIKLKLEHTFKLRDDVSGCCFLPDGKLVLCDRSRNDSVIILHPHGELMFETSMSPSFAFDVAYNDDNTVAVSSDYPSYKQINIINIDTKTIRSIRTEDACSGITHKEESLIVCVRGKGIQKVNKQSGERTSIVSCKLGSWSYIVSSDNKLYYTNRDDNTVTCCDMGGNIIWTFKDENVLKDPRGIAVDNTGNIYTVSNNNNTLIVLSADGQKRRQLLSKDDGLHNPNALAYDKIRNRLCVLNLKNAGYLFDVTF
ncbi:protein lin-41-like [Mytilus edulis]|uniref:protein lin-41-like n=1 Tax=Mytilus edulis TaxID=6550 RepID=UPI0039F1137C